MIDHEKITLKLAVARLEAQADGFEVIDAVLAEDVNATDQDFGLIHVALRRELDSLAEPMKERLRAIHAREVEAATRQPLDFDGLEEPPTGEEPAQTEEPGDSASPEGEQAPETPTLAELTDGEEQV